MPFLEFRRVRSEEHTSELQSHSHLVCRLLLEKKKKLTKFNGANMKSKMIRASAVIILFLAPSASKSLAQVASFFIIFFFFLKAAAPQDLPPFPPPPPFQI